MKISIPLLIAASAVTTQTFTAQAEGHEARDTRGYEQAGKARSDPRCRRIEDLIGADVRLTASPGGESADKPTGRVEDLLIASDGTIEWAVVECDGRQVLVAARELGWNPQHECFDLTFTKDGLTSKPEFDLDEARESGLAQSVERVESRWNISARKEAREAGQRKGQATFEGTKFQRSDASLLCGSAIDELELFGLEEEFGGVTKTFVDPAAMRVDMVVVSRGGIPGIGDTNYLVPFAAMTLCHEPLENGEDASDVEMLLCVKKSVKALESAPEYEEPDQEGVLVTETDRAAALKFFGLKNGDS